MLKYLRLSLLLMAIEHSGVSFGYLLAGIHAWGDTEITAVVPEGTAAGDVVATTTEWMESNSVPFTVGVSTVPDGSGEASSWTTTFSGAVTANTVWTENILLTGDVTVNSGVNLTIEPGVTVFLPPTTMTRPPVFGPTRLNCTCTAH